MSIQAMNEYLQTYFHEHDAGGGARIRYVIDEGSYVDGQVHFDEEKILADETVIIAKSVGVICFNDSDIEVFFGNEEY